jgi:hypothetical protein
VDCMWEDGSTVKCTKLVVAYMPKDRKIGPFCPKTLDDENGGIWGLTGENAGLYRVNRAFFEMMEKMGYRFYNDDGTVHIADIAIAEPVHDHACIQVSTDDTVKITMLVPTTPKMAESLTALEDVFNAGVALDGVPIFSDAPPIQLLGHMPALDTCGGQAIGGETAHMT